jgi:hypothetical protein
LLYAEQEFRLSMPMPDGHSKRAHLEAAARGGARVAPASAKCPLELAYLWQWFNELSRSRPTNGFGPCSLPYSEIAAWCQLHNRSLQEWELALILALDDALLNVLHKQTQKANHV